jgi:hypothetical protein
LDDVVAGAVLSEADAVGVGDSEAGVVAGGVVAGAVVAGAGRARRRRSGSPSLSLAAS